MTSVGNIVQTMPQNVRNVNFKAGENDRYSRYQAPVITQPPMLDQQDQLMLRAMQEQKKQEKNKKLKNNIITGVSVASGLAIIAMVIAQFKMMKGGAANNELKQMVETNLKWVDFAKGEKTVAPLSSKTTSQKVQKAFQDVIDSENLSDKAKKWAGELDQTDFILLYGHSGVGKTYIAEQYAQETNALFANIKFPDLGSPYKDASSMKISNFFDQIMQYSQQNKDRKIVVCMDEVDAIIKKVAEGNGAGEASKSRAAFLTGIDLLRKNKCNNVKLIATTNYHPDSKFVDNASLRRAIKIETPLGDTTQNLEMLKLYLKNSGAEVFKDGKFLESAELKDFAQKLTDGGFCNGEIADVCKNSIKAFRASLKGVAESDIEKHKFTVQMLEDALKLQGTAASKTNTLMNPNAII